MRHYPLHGKGSTDTFPWRQPESVQGAKRQRFVQDTTRKVLCFLHEERVLYIPFTMPTRTLFMALMHRVGIVSVGRRPCHPLPQGRGGIPGCVVRVTPRHLSVVEPIELPGLAEAIDQLEGRGGGEPVRIGEEGRAIA